MSYKRHGVPGGNTFPYMLDDEEIFYAPNMAKAFEMFVQYHGHEPFSIRLMADNE
jgi:hypothetical protein